MARHIKVLMAEDHDVVREGLRVLISADASLEVAGGANNGKAALRMAKRLHPDVVLMDLAMPGTNGLDAARHIRRHVPASKILVLSAYHDAETIQRVLDVGASGYMTKHAAAEDLLEAIREVGKGNSYYSPMICGKLKSRDRQSFVRGRPAPRVGQLTPREKEVLTLIARGQPNKEIAFTLGLSIKTVEKHRQAAMDKLDIHDIAGLTRYATDRGMLASPQ